MIISKYFNNFPKNIHNIFEYIYIYKLVFLYMKSFFIIKYNYYYYYYYNK